MSHKTQGELIVEMLCDGVPKKDIKAELGLTDHYFNEKLRVVRIGAGLPYDTKTYKARRDDILSNVAKWKAYRAELEKMKKHYHDSLIQFDF